MRMFQISATMRIAIGLAFVSVTLLLVSMVIDLIPDRRGAEIESRRAICEMIAISCSVHARQDEIGCPIEYA